MTMIRTSTVLVVSLLLASSISVPVAQRVSADSSATSGGYGQSAEPLSALARMPVKEVTVFKDGHSFVLHQGAMPTDSTGDVLMDYLPEPVLGTFWPYSSDSKARLTSVVASRHQVLIDRTALTIEELLKSNPGAEVLITENNGVRYAARIAGIPTRSSQEMRRTSPPGSDELLPQKGPVIMLKTDEGVKVVATDQIRDVTFKQSPKTEVSGEEFRNMLTLKLDWGGRSPEKTADVGLMYLQAGLRWIPGYKVTIDGNGNANVKLQATLVNDLTDLDDVTANLVIGVPTFAFKDATDPIALQQIVASVSPAFGRRDLTSQMMVNSIATQVAAPMMDDRGTGAASPTGPEIDSAAASEDLFVFTAKHISLKKGQRMVVPVAEYNLQYKDVFTIDIPYAPPPEVRLNLNTEQQEQLARVLSGPSVMHEIRLTNKSQYPLTTAPAMIVRDNRIIAQGLMKYTATGSSGDLEVTKAVDVQVLKNDVESKRTPNSVRIDGNEYTKIDQTGSLKITNFQNRPVYLEITRHLLGNVDSADNDAEIEKVNLIEDERYMPSGERPFWWAYYGWPNWWHEMNGIGRITWKLNLEPGKNIELGYTWHYFWR